MSLMSETHNEVSRPSQTEAPWRINWHHTCKFVSWTWYLVF